MISTAYGADCLAPWSALIHRIVLIHRINKVNRINTLNIQFFITIWHIRKIQNGGLTPNCIWSRKYFTLHPFGVQPLSVQNLVKIHPWFGPLTNIEKIQNGGLTPNWIGSKKYFTLHPSGVPPLGVQNLVKIHPAVLKCIRVQTDTQTDRQPWSLSLAPTSFGWRKAISGKLDIQ